MKGFYIEITNRLLEPKHRKAMRESVWLFMWFIDRMTSINEQGIGKVLGGKPIKYSEVNADLDIPERTYTRWVGWLKKGGYINTIRTPYGLSITINKAKKKFKRDTPKMAYQSGRDTPKGVERYAKTGVEIRQIGGNKEDSIKDIYKDQVFKPLSEEEAIKRLRPRYLKIGAEK